MSKSKSKLGDTRLDRVHGMLINAMSKKMSVILRRLGKTKGEEVAFGRFINNPKINPQNIVDHYQEVEPIDFAGKHILVVEDSSSASFKLNSNRKDLGYIGPNTSKTGFQLHSAIYMDANDGGCYGLGGLKIWKTKKAQTPEDKARRIKRRKESYKIPFKDKERFKWYSVVDQAISNNPNATRHTIVGDREADIYELLNLYRDQAWDFVIRSSRSRRISDGEKLIGTLDKAIKNWKVQGIYELDLPRTDKRSAHQASLEVKFNLVNIVKPKDIRNENLADILPVYVLEVKELERTVIGAEKPVHWVILTSHPVETLEQAMEVIQWYRWRWVIEQVFRSLKSQGLNIEQSEVESYHALANLATLALIAAVQVLQLVQAREGTTNQDLDSVFLQDEIQCLTLLNQKLEGNTEKTKNPHAPTSLAFGAWIIGRLGGWKGYKKARPPGPITMLNGINRFYDIIQGFYLLI